MPDFSEFSRNPPGVGAITVPAYISPFLCRQPITNSWKACRVSRGSQATLQASRKGLSTQGTAGLCRQAENQSTANMHDYIRRNRRAYWWNIL